MQLDSPAALSYFPFPVKSGKYRSNNANARIIFRDQILNFNVSEATMEDFPCIVCRNG